MPVDDQHVPPTEVLYRRIARHGDTNMLVVDEVTGERRIRSGAFVVDDDGCSIYFRSVLEVLGLGVSDVVRAPQNVVISVTVKNVRDVGMGVWPDPCPPDSDGHLRDVAHGLIVNSGGLGSKRLYKALRRLAPVAVICYGASTG